MGGVIAVDDVDVDDASEIELDAEPPFYTSRGNRFLHSFIPSIDTRAVTSRSWKGEWC